MAAAVHLTPEQSAAFGRALGQLVGLLARWLHLPWWASLLLLTAAAAGLYGLAVVRDRLLRHARDRRVAEADRIQSVMPALSTAAEPLACGHCGRPTASSARILGTPWCRTGRVPPTAEPRDCYRLVLEEQHRLDGTCCQKAGQP